MPPDAALSTLRRVLLLASLTVPAAAVQAQTAAWPERPVRWIVNVPPGGAADTLSRVLAEQIGTRLGQPIAVENRSRTSPTSPWSAPSPACFA